MGHIVIERNGKFLGESLPLSPLFYSVAGRLMPFDGRDLESFVTNVHQLLH